MTELALPIKFILAFILGMVIGSERQIHERDTSHTKNPSASLLGLRTFSLISILGVIVGLLYEHYPLLSILIGASCLAQVLLFYILDSKQTKDAGITTEFSLLYSFLIGVLIAIELIPIELILAITVMLLILLSKKEEIHTIVGGIRRREINAFLLFAIIAAVILPFLPNQSYTVAAIPGLESFLSNIGFHDKRMAGVELINPFKLWLIVALITGVDLLGYIMERTVGARKGWLLASIAGGFISSTATTETLAIQSKTAKETRHLLASAILANGVSFVQIAILIGSVNIRFLSHLLPTLLSMGATALVLAWHVLKTKEKHSASRKLARKADTASIIEFWSALRFAALYLLIGIAAKVALLFAGNAGFLVAIGIGALVGLDAVMINTAQIAGGPIDYTLAAYAFVLANAVNLFGKVSYGFFNGARSFARSMLIYFLTIIAISLIGVYVTT